MAGGEADTCGGASHGVLLRQALRRARCAAQAASATSERRLRLPTKGVQHEYRDPVWNLLPSGIFGSFFWNSPFQHINIKHEQGGGAGGGGWRAAGAGGGGGWWEDGVGRWR